MVLFCLMKAEHILQSIGLKEHQMLCPDGSLGPKLWVWWGISFSPSSGLVAQLFQWLLLLKPDGIAALWDNGLLLRWQLLWDQGAASFPTSRLLRGYMGDPPEKDSIMNLYFGMILRTKVLQRIPMDFFFHWKRDIKANTGTCLNLRLSIFHIYPSSK